MAYSDIIGATKLYGDLLNTNFSNIGNNLSNVKMDYSPVNPYSSGAYTPRSARNIYTGEGRNIVDPVAQASNTGFSTGENLLMKGSQALQYGTMATKLSPYLQKAATSLGAPGTMGGLGPAAMLYGATRNQNPYDWSTGESLGTIGSTVMAGQALAPLLGMTTAAAPAGFIGPLTAAGGTGAAGASILGMHPGLALGSLLVGSLLSGRGRKKARKARKQAGEDIRQQQDDIYTQRAEAVKEGRDNMQADLLTKMYDERQGRYDNQYGGNYDTRAYADEGMKMEKNIVAEFTGNELIVNDQNDLENDIASGNNKSAANRIRMAMKGGNITPGEETHKGNPMPVDAEGTIYAGGGALPFKANKGAGIYDHATDQFKMDMDDDTIVKVVKKNMNKWKSNGMA